jgi:hypothetical protein
VATDQEDMSTEDEQRVPPDEVIWKARLLPEGGSVAVIDGDFASDERVPGNAVRGAWEVLPGGTLSGVFHVNPGFDPNHARPRGG